MTAPLSDIARRGDPVAGTATLSIEIIADLVCPFCFIGKRRLDEALKAVQGPSAVSWYPYQLNPDIPAAGLSFDEYVGLRFGSRGNIDPVLKFLASEGRATGIDFRFDRLQHVPNTLPVHQVLQQAEMRGLDQSALADDLLSAFFEHGRNIGDEVELIDIASRNGLSPAETREAIHSDQLRQVVLSREAQVRSSGLAGVPGFLVNRRLLVVGAQGTDNMINAFDRAMFGEGTEQIESPALH